MSAPQVTVTRRGSGPSHDLRDREPRAPPGDRQRPAGRQGRRRRSPAGTGREAAGPHTPHRGVCHPGGRRPVPGELVMVVETRANDSEVSKLSPL